MSRQIIRVVALASLALALSLVAGAQEPGAAPGAVRFSTGSTPDTVTVGQPFRVALRIRAPAGSQVELPARPEHPESLEALADLEVVSADLEQGEWLAAYAFVAWTTGEPVVPPLPVRVTHGDGSVQNFSINLPLPHVRSVLPADTAGVEPRGAKGLIERAAGFPWWLLAVAVALVAAIAAWLILRSRRRQPAATVLPLRADPRQEALALLDRARAEGLVEAGTWKVFFSRVSGALRSYLAALSPRWGEDLTTSEVADALRRDGVDGEELIALLRVLERADLVKFSIYEPTADEAERVWAAAREWVERFEPAPERAESAAPREAA